MKAVVKMGINVSFQNKLSFCPLESNKYIVSGENAKDFKIKTLILRFQTQMKIFLWPSPH